MRIKEKMRGVYRAIDDKFLEQFGFRIKETTFPHVVKYLHVPKNSSSLAVTRILFGLLMLFDIPDERGGSIMKYLWGRKHICHFPLVPFITALPMPYMGIVYAAMWLGAAGIMLGYKYRTSSVMFTVAYWYLFLVEKSSWNNHSYLFGLVALLLTCTEANCYWSLETYLDPSKEKQTVPYWNYFVLKYQFFILYFMAGMKKGTAEWLDGYSVPNLAAHWVFDPFKLFLSSSEIDYLIVHCFIFVFDLTVAIWMMWARTRNIAVFFCSLFHLMNSRLFTIGMFPWVCLATLPLFYPLDWPKTLGRCFKDQYLNIETLIRNKWKSFNNKTGNYKWKVGTDEDKNEKDNLINKPDFNDKDTKKEENKIGYDENKKCNLISKLDLNYENTKKEENNDGKQESAKTIDEKKNSQCAEENDDKIDETATDQGNVEENNSEILEDQLFINYNDLKLNQSKESKYVTGNKKRTTCLIMLYAFVQAFLPYSHFITKGYNNWTDGLYGYSWDMMVHSWHVEEAVIKVVDNVDGRELYLDPDGFALNDRWKKFGDMVYQYSRCIQQRLEATGMPRNVSLYFDIWCSMNGRFTQRMFDPKVDLLKASWSPFQRVSYLMPLLDEASYWRSSLKEITEEVHSWSNGSDVVFFADFPSYHLEKFVPEDLSNVSLTILKGVVAYEPGESTQTNQSYKLTAGDRIRVRSGYFHRVHNIGTRPAYYMYTFTNTTIRSDGSAEVKPKLPIFKELYNRINRMLTFAGLVNKCFYEILFGCDGKC